MEQVYSYSLWQFFRFWKSVIMFLQNTNYKLLCMDQIRLVYMLFGRSTYTKTEIGSQLLEIGTCHIKISISGFSWEKIREFGDTELTFLMAAISPNTYKCSPFCWSLCLLALVLLLIYFTLRAFIVIEIAILFLGLLFHRLNIPISFSCF